MRISRPLYLRIDKTITRCFPEAVQQAKGAAFRDGVGQHIRDLFSKLGGLIETLKTSQDEIRVVWVQENENTLDAIVDMLTHGQYGQAILCMELLLSDDQDNNDLLYNLGMAYSDIGALDRATIHLNKLLKNEPDHVNGRIALGVAYTRQGNTGDAIKELQRAVMEDPANPWAQRNLGGALAKTGQMEKAVIHLKNAAELNPSDQLAWYGYAQVLELNGDEAQAEVIYKRSIDIDEFSDAAELAREALTKLAQRSFHSALPGIERPDAVMYCLGALERFEKMTLQEMQTIGFEIAMLGRGGLDVNDSTQKYKLKSLPGNFSGLHLVSIMYVAFKKFAPDQDVGFDLSVEYRRALVLHSHSKGDN
jgi:Tfp pilus assembly protein PilF